MLDSFFISFRLKITYRVNGFLYSLKCVPLLGRLLPDRLYCVRGLKILAGIFAGLWELVSMFLGKFLYLWLMVLLPAGLYKGDQGEIFIHILAMLSVIGMYANTYMFDPSNDKYYAMFLLRMDARKYTISNYIYTVLRQAVGFLPMLIVAGMQANLAVWESLMFLPLILGGKLAVAAWDLIRYEKTGDAVNENSLSKAEWILMGVLLAAAYGLPALEITIPAAAVLVISVPVLAAGLIGVRKIRTFRYYREMYQQILAGKRYQMDSAVQTIANQDKKYISSDRKITSSKKGFEYFHELFVKRHRKVLWKSTWRMTAFAAAVWAGCTALVLFFPEVGEGVNRFLISSLPYFVFIMYSINRGSLTTRIMFMNCDHMMLTYAFYRKPENLLKLFGIRLRECIRLNLPTALVIGAGLAVLLYLTGGTENPLNYGILFVSILAMSVFFSVHNLICYYLLQPYNAALEIKSKTSSLVSSVTYLICFACIRVRLPIFGFGLLAICFAVLYSIGACVLVYKKGSETFRLRT